MSRIADHTQRLERIGGRMRAVTIALMLATPGAFAAVVFLDGFAALLPVPRDVVLDLSAQSAGGFAVIAGLAAVKPAVFLVALWLLQDLFGLYRRGAVFEARNVRRLGHLGWALIGIDLADMAQRLIAGPLLTHLGATEPFFSLGLGLGLSIVGLFVIVIARVMDLGRELKEFESLAI